MIRRTLMILSALALIAGNCYGALTKDQIIIQLRDLLEQQGQDLEQAEKKANDGLRELGVAKNQVGQIVTERDGWKAYGENEHEKWMNAETRVAKAQKEVWRLRFFLGGIVALIGVYLFLKFYLHIPI